MRGAYLVDVGMGAEPSTMESSMLSRSDAAMLICGHVTEVTNTTPSTEIKIIKE